MSNTPTEGCPRCDDYDEVVEELNKEKESRKQEVKSELHKCEDRHKKKDAKIKGLEKKILAMTIAAVIGGTIIGKEFIDEIASYIKSFSDVKNVVTGLGSSLPTITVSKNDEESKDMEEEINDYSTITFAPRKPSTTVWPPVVSLSEDVMDFSKNFDLISLISEYTLNQNHDLYKSMLFDDHNAFSPRHEIYDLTKYYMETPYYDTDDIEFTPTALYDMNSVSYVPESEAWTILILPCLMNKRRRRL